MELISLYDEQATPVPPSCRDDQLLTQGKFIALLPANSCISIAVCFLAVASDRFFICQGRDLPLLAKLLFASLWLSLSLCLSKTGTTSPLNRPETEIGVLSVLSVSPLLTTPTVWTCSLQLA